MTLGIAIWLGTAILGCGSKVSGKYVYTGPTGNMTIDFESGQATMNLDGMSETDPYTISGNTITINRPQGAGTFTIQDDGSLQGMGMTLTKAAN
ncbi:MAG: hypothetical protein ABSF29_02340 [Tepidisphaeraceae bacterium]|jgi:hypothetical protein